MSGFRLSMNVKKKGNRQKIQKIEGNRGRLQKMRERERGRRGLWIVQNIDEDIRRETEKKGVNARD